ncbi:hypothetical protein OAT71_00080 [Flavobacteriales bacterium]|nr:hypothetical protein [Flavobacteriales bacterium]
MKRIITLGLAGALCLTSCKKDEENNDTDDTNQTVTTVAQDKVNIANSINSINGCADEIQTGKAISLIKNMFNISQGESDEDQIEWMEPMLDSLPSVFDFDAVLPDEGFVINMSTHQGVYSYSNSTNEWVKTAATNGTVEFLFPSTNGGSNNLSLNVSNYTGEALNFDGEDIDLPKTLNVLFKHNSDRIVEINLNNAQYEELESISIPTYVDLDVFVNPVEISVLARKVNSTLLDLNIDITNDGECSMSSFAEVSLHSDDYENLEDEDIDYVRGHVAFDNLKIESNVNTDVLAAMDDPTLSQINNMHTTEVFYDAIKVADLEYYENVETDTVFWGSNPMDYYIDYDYNENFEIIYKDGSREMVKETYLLPLLEDLEITLFNFLGDWYDEEDFS